MRMTVRLQGALQSIVMAKVLHMSATGNDNVTTNLLYQVYYGECLRMPSFIPYILRTLNVVLLVIGVFVYMGFIAGWPAVGAVGVFLLLTPVNLYLARKLALTASEGIGATEARTLKVIEMVGGIRVLKFFGWEKKFETIIAKLRQPELECMYRTMGVAAGSSLSVAIAQPTMQVLLFILIGIKSGEKMDTLIFYQCISLISIVSLGLAILPHTINSFAMVQAGMGRLTQVLMAKVDNPSSSSTHLLPPPASSAYALTTVNEFCDKTSGDHLCLDNTVFSYDAKRAKSAVSSAEDLQIQEFTCKPGELVLIVGATGSGKSSLLHAIRGDMHHVQGDRHGTGTLGTIAYAPQRAWLINASIRNNIILFEPFDQEKYDAILEDVDLAEDIATFPYGDLTEVGMKGLTLSGGQKQRIELARALYHGGDTYMFDDPLSALDAHVGGKVFTKAIQGRLKGKTRILVTHNMSLVDKADRVYFASDMKITTASKTSSVLEKEGSTDESAFAKMVQSQSDFSSGVYSPTEAPKKTSAKASWKKAINRASTTVIQMNVEKKRKKDEYRNFMLNLVQKTSEQEGLTGMSTILKQFKEQQSDERKRMRILGMREERMSGRVDPHTLWTYLTSLGGAGFWIPLVLLQMTIVCAVIFSILWMSFWSSNKFPEFYATADLRFMLGIYAAALLAQSILIVLKELFWRRGATRAPAIIYEKMLKCVLAAPMTFFDSTPAGRIINRFTNDCSQLDNNLPGAVNTVISIMFMQLGGMIATCVIMPVFTPAVVLVLLALAVIQPTVAVIVLRRLSSATAAPLTTAFSDALDGLTSIRLYKIGDKLLRRFYQQVDAANTCEMTAGMVVESVMCRMNLVMSIFFGGSILIIIAMKDTMNTADASFVVNQVLYFTIYAAYTIEVRAGLMMALNSLERILQYSQIPGELGGSVEPPSSWPSTGSVEFRNVSARYRPGLPLVLKSLSLFINSGERIGVCGRTGSGKSSFLLCLFRMVGLEEGSRVMIDGVDIATMPLATLRSSVACIPQEAVVFSGTLLSNFDPLEGKVDTDRILHLLDLCQLMPTLQWMMGNLPAAERPSNVLGLKVDENTFSAGQRQLLCLARAIARDAKVMVLDEATSSVDILTDGLLQKAIREACAGRTVITVAHRLNTIVDSDRVIVLQHGEVAEFDDPRKLLQNPESLFAQLISEATGGDHHPK